MTMTRKDFEAVARAIADARDDLPPTPEAALARVTYHLADVLHVAGGLTSNGNRRFDRERFIRTAGGS